VRARRLSVPSAGSLGELDRRLLGVLCAHRVVTQAQFERLFPDVPERTLRYRMRRLHALGLAGRTRPYRERGSAPNHHWPSRRADCSMRGDPAPRGGERREPNPVFLAHSAGLSELYVTLATQAANVGLGLYGYSREGCAREPFQHRGRDRALAPDALVTFLDGEGHELLAFVELDLGTMSHARLRQKAELYGAYAAGSAWRKRHVFQPALLFLTTSPRRAAGFLRALCGVLSVGPRRVGRHPLVAGAASVAWDPGLLLAEGCLVDLEGRDGITLPDLLCAARAPYERAITAERAHRQAAEEKRRLLWEDPLAMHRHLRSNQSSLSSYARELGPVGERTLAILLDADPAASLSSDERGLLRAIARDLGEALLQPGMSALAPPGAAVQSKTPLLTEAYRTAQHKQLRQLTEQHGDGPQLRNASEQLHDGGLLDHQTLKRLSSDAKRDNHGRREQTEHRVAYEQWRESAARTLARKAGALGRLTHRAEDFYPQLDQQHLRVCRGCAEIVYPSPEPAWDSHDRPTCHYCHSSERIAAYDCDATAPEGTLHR